MVGEMDCDDIEDEDSEMEDEEEEEEDDESEDSDAYVYGDDELYEKPLKKGQAPPPEEPKMKKRKKNDTSANPLLVEMGEDGAVNDDENVSAVKKAKQWYQKDIFKDVDETEDNDVDDDYDIEQMLTNFKKKGGKVLKKPEEEVTEVANEDDQKDAEEESGEEGESTDEESDAEDDDSSGDEEIDDRSISQGKPKQEPEAKSQKKNGFEIAKQDYLGPEELAMGMAMATSKKRKRDIIESAYNRYTFNDENLPAWFTDDENKHTYRQVPVTREEVEQYKQRMRELNARPIKKVIEAKAKKKSKMIMKLNRARKKAQGILDSNDTS